MQCRILFRLEIIASFAEILDVLLPGSDRIWLRGTGDLKDLLPQFFFSLPFWEIREDFSCPGRCTGRDDTPIRGITAQGNADFLKMLEMSFLQHPNAFWIQPAIDIRVVGMNGQ